MRISDWSSDVCSSDLGVHRRRAGARGDLRALIAERRLLRRPQCPPPFCFRPPVLAPREGSVAVRQHSWAAWRRGRAARCDAANAALREVGAAYPRQAEAVRGISRVGTNLAKRPGRRGGTGRKHREATSRRAGKSVAESDNTGRDQKTNKKK